jgi:hypothetical protein
MRFLLKIALLMTLVLVLLPSGRTGTASNTPVSAGDAMTAAMAAVDDMRSFCERQPQTCTVGSQAATAIGHRAQVGAKMLYDFLTEQLGPPETGSIKRNAATVRAAPASQHTLTPDDVAAPWRGPQPPGA